MKPVGILGAGAWGTALATAAVRAGNRVVLWGRDPRHMAAIQQDRENARFLPGVPLGPEIVVTADTDALREADLLLAAVPAQALRATLDAVSRSIGTDAQIVICCKGIEQGSGLLMSDVVGTVRQNNPVSVLSGPSFAADVGRGLPTAVTIAAGTMSGAASIADRLASPTFRLYHTDDVAGVEIGGAVKNVLAIACGVADGRGLGASAVAALTARAFAELLRYGRAHGARAETLMGLSGFGDLVLTCRSAQSRNFAFGLALGRGESIDSAGRGRLVEGALTAPILIIRARDHGVSMPIVEATAAILQGRLGIDEAVEALLARPAKPEG